MTNIIGVNNYVDTCLATIANHLRSTFDTKISVEQIEIEIKCAEFIRFGPEFDASYFQNVSSQTYQNINNMFKYQRSAFFQCLEKLSKQHILHLNPLGEIYQVLASFDEARHKKFYHIKEFLIKMCEYNRRNNYEKRPLSSNQNQEAINLYRQFSLNYGGHLLRLVQDNQLRLDIRINALNDYVDVGRYSYSTKYGWKLTQKELFQPQIDFMLSQRPYRFAINREIEKEIPLKTVKSLAAYMQSAEIVGQIQIKKMLRVAKGDICEYSFSEIYQFKESNRKILRPNLIKQMKDFKLEKFNIYLSKVFVNFYSLHEKENSHFEIESELSKPMSLKLKCLLQSGNTKEVEKQVESIAQELHSLFYCEHATRKNQMAWLSRKVKDVPEGRLDNQHGTYMRHILYGRMSKQ